MIAIYILVGQNVFILFKDIFLPLAQSYRILQEKSISFQYVIAH